MFKEGCGVRKAYIACGYTDLRYGVDGLAALVQYQFDLNPFDEGTIFLFCGRKADRVKALLWEGLSEDSCYPHILLRNRIDFSRYSYSFP